jgi:hypothetical protein
VKHKWEKGAKLLLAGAETAGDEDEVLVEMIEKYLEWRRAAQKEAQGQAPTKCTIGRRGNDAALA